MSEPEDVRDDEREGADNERELFKRMIREGVEQRRQDGAREEMQGNGGCLGILFRKRQPQLSDDERREQMKQRLHDRLGQMSDENREAALEMLGDAANTAKAGGSGSFRSALEDSFADQGAAMLGEAREALQQLVESRVEDRRNAPALECPIREIDRPAWLGDEPFVDWIQALEGRGFQLCGTYERPDLHCELAALGHPELNCGATLYCLPGIQIMEFFSASESGDVREASNYAPARFAALPEWFEMRVEYSGGMEKQLDRFLEGHNADACSPVNSESYVALTRDIHHRLTAWKIERGGETWDELRKQMEAGGHLPEDPDEQADFMDVVRRNDAERHLSAWWKLQSDAPRPLEEVMETLVIIHDDLTPDLLLQDYWRVSENYRFRERDLPDLPPREAWGKLMTELGNPMRKVMEKKTGFPADYYLPAD